MKDKAWSLLARGEYVLVNKLAYYLGEPERGDIIVMHHSAERDFIKRIVGLPGDHVVINDNHDVLVNGVKLNEPYLNGPPLRRVHGRYPKTRIL